MSLHRFSSHVCYICRLPSNCPSSVWVKWKNHYFSTLLHIHIIIVYWYAAVGAQTTRKFDELALKDQRPNKWKVSRNPTKAIVQSARFMLLTWRVRGLLICQSRVPASVTLILLTYTCLSVQTEWVQKKWGNLWTACTPTTTTTHHHQQYMTLMIHLSGRLCMESFHTHAPAEP